MKNSKRSTNAISHPNNHLIKHLKEIKRSQKNIDLFDEVGVSKASILNRLYVQKFEMSDKNHSYT